jgi:DNA-binding NarL/FixJ family response regulator
MVQSPKASNMLSSREKEVIALLAKGLSYQNIATELLISHETVKKHVNQIYRKLHVKSKVQALIKIKSL